MLPREFSRVHGLKVAKRKPKISKPPSASSPSSQRVTQLPHSNCAGDCAIATRSHLATRNVLSEHDSKEM